jgi:hypothetical protein
MMCGAALLGYKVINDRENGNTEGGDDDEEKKDYTPRTKKKLIDLKA